jgi:SulP family sulfate permease
MAGCAMIGQSVINVKSGGRGRLSTLVAGVFLMILILLLNNILVQIPMAALVGVMIMVSIGTFDWSSLRKLHIMPVTDSTVMIVTVVTVVFTHDLSKGVLAGVLLSAIFFAAKISKVQVETKLNERNNKTYSVKGQLFFASVSDLISNFDFKEEVEKVVIDFSHAHLWDDSAVGAVDKIVLKYKLNGTEVSIVGLNKDSSTLVKKLAVYDKVNAKMANH